MNNATTYRAPKTYTKDEKLIWQVLIFNDFVAFCSQDWELIADDFISDGVFWYRW